MEAAEEVGVVELEAERAGDEEAAVVEEATRAWTVGVVEEAIEADVGVDALELREYRLSAPGPPQ